MSIKLDTNTLGILLEHIAYSETMKLNEDVNSPNEKGAENFCLGEKSKLPCFFYPETIGKHLDSEGTPHSMPLYIDKRFHLVASVLENNGAASRVNVYAIYKIQGIRDILSLHQGQTVTWEFMEIPKKLYSKLIQKIIMNRGLLLVPTPNWKTLEAEEKKEKEYYNVRIQKVPFSKSHCSIS